MIPFVGGLIIGLSVGMLIAFKAVGMLFLSGRVTFHQIAERCDRLIAETAEPSGPPPRRRTL